MASCLRSRPLSVAVLAIATLTAEVPAPSPAPTIAPATSSGTCDTPPSSTAALLSRPVADKLVLRLIARLEGEPQDVQRTTFDAVRRGTSHATAVAVTDAVGDRCTKRDVAFMASRLALTVGSRWALYGTDRRVLERAARLAIAGITLRTSLRESSVNATLAPFGTTLAELALLRNSELAGIASGAACNVNRNPEMFDRVAPAFPAGSAPDPRTHVDVAFQLDDEGSVVSASVKQSNVPHTPRGRDLTNAAILSIATSRFHPEIASCRNVPGSYVATVFFGR